jgi:quinol monooxygenase YgiN
MLTWRGVSKLCSADTVHPSNRRDVWRHKDLLVISREWSETLGIVLPATRTKANLCAFLTKLGTVGLLVAPLSEVNLFEVVVQTKSVEHQQTRSECRKKVIESVKSERENVEWTAPAAETKKMLQNHMTTTTTPTTVMTMTTATIPLEFPIETKLRRDIRRETKDIEDVSGKKDVIVAALIQIIVEPQNHATVRGIVLERGRVASAYHGHVRTSVHQLRPGSLYVLSKWRNEAAMDAYLTTFLSRESLKTTTLARYLVSPPSVTRAKMLSQPRPKPPMDVPQVTLVPFFSVIPDATHIKRVMKAHLSVIDSTRREPGCLEYDLYQLIGAPQLMFFYENWASPETLAKHMNTSTFYRVVRNQVDPYLLVPWTALNMQPVYN